jgi:hypothetical protein
LQARVSPYIALQQISLPGSPVAAAFIDAVRFEPGSFALDTP